MYVCTGVEVQWLWRPCSHAAAVYIGWTHWSPDLGVERPENGYFLDSASSLRATLVLTDVHR